MTMPRRRETSSCKGTYICFPSPFNAKQRKLLLNFNHSANPNEAAHTLYCCPLIVQFSVSWNFNFVIWVDHITPNMPGTLALSCEISFLIVIMIVSNRMVVSNTRTFVDY